MARFLGLDIGTTSTIGILIDETGRILATAACPATLTSPHAGWAEEDPQQWWHNVCAVIPRLLRAAACDGSDITAIGVAGMVPAVVLLDRDGQVLRPSIQQSDGRAGTEVAALAMQIDAETFLRRTGNTISQQLVATKLRWLETHEPDVFSRIATVCGSYDYIVWKLTETRSLERNWALEGGFLDLHSGDLVDDFIDLAHIPPAALPPVHTAHEVVGTVSPAAAAASGLADGIPVIAGCADHVASAYVAGVVAPGDVLIKFGGAGDILAATGHLIPDRRLFTDYHPIPGLFMPNGCMACSGSLLNWFVQTFADGVAAEAVRSGHSLHRHLDRLAAAVPAGAGGIVALPYFLGEKTPIHDPDARGTLIGLSLNHEVGHVWRALLEAVVFGFRHHLDVLDDIGYPVSRILASDGGTASRLWMQIAADILQHPIRVLDDHPGACLGAAWLAGIGCGALDDWSAAGRAIGQGVRIDPTPGNQTCYDAQYAVYRDLYTALRPIFAHMAGRAVDR